MLVMRIFLFFMSVDICELVQDSFIFAAVVDAAQGSMSLLMVFVVTPIGLLFCAFEWIGEHILGFKRNPICDTSDASFVNTLETRKKMATINNAKDAKMFNIYTFRLAMRGIDMSGSPSVWLRRMARSTPVNTKVTDE